MSATASIVVLFGLSCAEPCPLSAGARAALEQAAAREVAARGFDVRPAPEGAVRPTDPDSVSEPRDEARALDAARVIVLDVEPEAPRVWITHYVRGSVGPWKVVRHTCPERGASPCPGFEEALVSGLRPRRADDVDFVGFLSGAAPAVGQCVRAEDRVPPALRIFGRVELELEVTPDGQVRVATIAPARAARGALGRCLRRTFESRDVGPFEGAPVQLRIPLDL